jgi:DeoR/GlpR family transcriptional regulator of sugar metabolism
VRKGHHLAERRQAILNALVEAGQLSVEELSQRFAVSEVTIRTDLQALHQQNVLLRTRGGAMAIRVLPELSFDVRQQQNAEKKTRIGKAAAQMIQNSDTIALDPSTTALAIIPFLEKLTELTVVTNSLKAALGLLRLPHVQVIMPGGYLRREAISLVGQPDGSLLRDVNIRIGFFGARGFTLKQGLTEINLEEVRTKQKIIQKCQVVVGVIDGRKWGQVAVATFAPPDHIHMIITDDSAPPKLVEEAQANGIEVLVV